MIRYILPVILKRMRRRRICLSLAKSFVDWTLIAKETFLTSCPFLPNGAPLFKMKSEEFCLQSHMDKLCGDFWKTKGFCEDVRAGHRGSGQPHNPISLILPCHRVVGVNGKLTGHADGLDKKRSRSPRKGKFGNLFHNKVPYISKSQYLELKR